MVDIVGTGGDGANTFNISTAAALVAAAQARPSRSTATARRAPQPGSADVLEALGIALEQPPERIALSIDELGFGFMFARAHHPAMRHAAPVRQELGDPHGLQRPRAAGEPRRGTRRGLRRLLADLAATYAEALAELGARHAFVVHGDGGLDELSPYGIRISWCEILDGDVREWELDPRELGIYPTDPTELSGGSAAENAATIRAVLRG